VKKESSRVNQFSKNITWSTKKAKKWNFFNPNMVGVIKMNSQVIEECNELFIYFLNEKSKEIVFLLLLPVSWKSNNKECFHLWYHTCNSIIPWNTVHNWLAFHDHSNQIINSMLRFFLGWRIMKICFHYLIQLGDRKKKRKSCNK